jgi:hypothetical protein
MVKQLNEHLKKVLKRQMLHPLLRCDTHRCYCRFAAEAWCLVEYSPAACDYIRTGKEEVATFKRRER